MVDDLTLQGVTEPYRMLTARAEYRLRLRADNAVTRLGDAAIGSGAASAERQAAIRGRLDQLSTVHDVLGRRVSGVTMADRIRQGEDVTEELMFHVEHMPQDVLTEAQDDARYAPYLERQRAEVARLRADANTALDRIHSYRAIGGLSNEMIERLEAAQPWQRSSSRPSDAPHDRGRSPRLAGGARCST
jgi:tRNA uridine 5-carboxymethylaminomethyl modification enzyme